MEMEFERDFEAEKIRQIKRMAEIEKVKKRREERARAKASQEELKAMLAGTRDRADLDIFSTEAMKKMQKERMAEIEKVKKRREERARAKAWQEELMAMLAGTRDRADLDIFSIEAMKKMQKERMAKIEKVKKRREERARAKAWQEELMAMLARPRAQAEFQD